jgi:hypothetical protein
VLGGLFAILSAVASVLWDFLVLSPAFLLLALGAFLMMMPVSGIFRISTRLKRMRIRRTILVVYSSLLAALVFFAFVFALINPMWGTGIGLILGSVFLFGWMIYSWVANLLIVIE